MSVTSKQLRHVPGGSAGTAHRRRRRAGPPGAASLRAALLLVAVAAGLLAPLPRAAGQQPSSTSAALQRAASSSQCPVTVRYDVDLGRREQDGSHGDGSPVFVGFLGISNNQEVGAAADAGALYGQIWCRTVLALHA